MMRLEQSGPAAFQDIEGFRKFGRGDSAAFTVQAGQAHFHLAPTGRRWRLHRRGGRRGGGAGLGLSRASGTDPGTAPPARQVDARGRVSIGTQNVTGRGGDAIIIDDPIKPMDAVSEAERQRVNEWFDSTVLSRLDDPASGAIAVVMQRVHEDDLSGHLLERGGWYHLCLPAITTEDADIPLDARRVWRRRRGDLLEPGRLAAEHLEEARRHLGSHLFEAQYQQDPMPAGGTLIRAEWLRPVPDGEGRDNDCFEQVVQSWDVASKVGGKNDWSVCTTWGVRRRQYVLLHVLRERLEFPDLLHRAAEIAQRFSAHRILVEDASSGSALAQALRALVTCPVIAIKPKLDKPARVQRASAVFEAGRVLLPADATWLPEYRRELLAFPGSRHDDQVDSTSQFLIWAEERPPPIPMIVAISIPKVSAATRPFWLAREGRDPPGGGHRPRSTDGCAA